MEEQKEYVFTDKKLRDFVRWVDLAVYLTDKEKSILRSCIFSDKYILYSNSHEINKILIGKCPFGYTQVLMEEIYGKSIEELRVDHGFDKHSI